MKANHWCMVCFYVHVHASCMNAFRRVNFDCVFLMYIIYPSVKKKRTDINMHKHLVMQNSV